jgi:hypothetical protein
MGKIYIDSIEWLIEVRRKWKNWEIIEFVDSNKEKINNNIEYYNSYFQEIYDNFNIENVFNNELIIENLKNIKTNEIIYVKFINFCNFLIKKIENSSRKSEIKKIPQIISNLSSYKWWRKYEALIIQKRNEVMQLYKKKLQNKKSL